MRAVRYHEHGGPEVLQVDDVPRPEAGHGELLVRVEAAGVNPVDTYFREGAYPLPGLPWTPASDVAGVVEAVGDGVGRFEPGDRVFATGLGRDRQGTCAEYVSVPEGLTATLPGDCGFEEGAAVALVGVTAWQALVHHGDIEPGERVLVHSGSGGVGHVAVQLAAAAGAGVTTTAAPAYHDHLVDLGARTVLDYDRDDLADAIADAGPPDLVLDTIADEYFELDGEVAARGATVVGIGNHSPTAPVPMGPGKFKDLRFQTMSMFNTPDTGAVLERLATLMTAGDVVPEIAGTYDLEGTADAQRDVLNESFLGKLVVTV
ncbi:MAG: NADPH:quinone reductase [Haloarculaceae archaeon]